MADQDKMPVSEFDQEVVLFKGGFHREIIGMAAGICATGVFVRKFDRHGQLVVALVPVDGQITELHGCVGKSDLLRAMLEHQQIEVPHLMSLIEGDSGETRMRALFVAGTLLGKRDHEPFDARLRPALRSLNPGESRKIISECSAKWLVMLLIEETPHMELLKEVADGSLRPDLTRSMRRAMRRRTSR